MGQGHEQHLNKEDTYMDNKHIKTYSTPCVIRELQILKNDTIILLLKWPKSQTLTMLNVGDDVEQEVLSFILG